MPGAPVAAATSLILDVNEALAVAPWICAVNALLRSSSNWVRTYPPVWSVMFMVCGSVSGADATVRELNARPSRARAGGCAEPQGYAGHAFMSAERTSSGSSTPPTAARNAGSDPPGCWGTASRQVAADDRELTLVAQSYRMTRM